VFFRAFATLFLILLICARGAIYSKAKKLEVWFFVITIFCFFSLIAINIGAERHNFSKSSIVKLHEVKNRVELAGIYNKIMMILYISSVVIFQCSVFLFISVIQYQYIPKKMDSDLSCLKLGSSCDCKLIINFTTLLLTKHLVQFHFARSMHQMSLFWRAF